MVKLTSNCAQIVFRLSIDRRTVAIRVLKSYCHYWVTLMVTWCPEDSRQSNYSENYEIPYSFFVITRLDCSVASLYFSILSTFSMLATQWGSLWVTHHCCLHHSMPCCTILRNESTPNEILIQNTCICHQHTLKFCRWHMFC